MFSNIVSSVKSPLIFILYVLSTTRAGPTLNTVANQAGSAASNGAAAIGFFFIPSTSVPRTAHGLCLGFGVGSNGLDSHLKDALHQDGSCSGKACDLPGFEVEGGAQGKSTWLLEEGGNLSLIYHNDNASAGSRYQIGGTVPVKEYPPGDEGCTPGRGGTFATGRRSVGHSTPTVRRYNGAVEKARVPTILGSCTWYRPCTCCWVSYICRSKRCW